MSSHSSSLAETSPGLIQVILKMRELVRTDPALKHIIDVQNELTANAGGPLIAPPPPEAPKVK